MSDLNTYLLASREIGVYSAELSSSTSRGCGMVQPCISHYEILRKLGEGGMGRVYEAHDRTLDRSVALKFLSPDLVGSPEQTGRFKREARAISALNHPNIATIHGFEEADGQHFLVLEYLPGGTLADKLAGLKRCGQTVQLDHALEWSTQIAEGLQHAHEHGVIHRDIKTSNVMFTADGRPKICDFGLAWLSEGAHETTDGRLLGTPRSMSPEQVRGAEADCRSDIFSLGILLYELFTGEAPFRGANAIAVMHEIVYSDPTLPAAIRHDIPERVQSTITKALSKKPDDRYQSVSELLRDLREAPEHAVPSAAEETITLAPARTPRHLAWVLLSAAMAVAILLGMFVLSPTARNFISARIHRVVIPAATALPAEKRIAVLPFDTKDPANRAFADGLNNTLSFKLAQLEQFHGSFVVVEAREISDKQVRVPSAAREKFGVNLAIIGELVRTENQVQALVSLVDTQNLVYLKTASIEARPSDMTVFRDQIVSKVAQMLDLQLSDEAKRALRRGETSVATAYTYYLEGRGYLQRYDQPENIAKAVSSFQAALSKDSKYALAYAGVAEARLREFNALKNPNSIEAAVASCSRAIQLNDSLAPVHVTMGNIRVAEGRYEDAEKEFQTALKLEPVSTEAFRGLADAYQALGRLKEAEATLKKAVTLRPSDWAGNNYLGAFYFEIDRFEDAATYFARAAEITPDNPMAHSNVGSAYLKMGRYAEAVRAFERSLAIRETQWAQSNLGMAYYYQGMYREAAAHHKRSVEIAPDVESYVGNLAFAYRHDPEMSSKAQETFRRAIALGETQLSINQRDPKLLARLALYRATLGDRQRSLSDINQALDLSPRSAYVQYRAAVVYDLAGNRRRALSAVKSALESGYSLEEIQKTPALENLRRDSRFKKLIQARLSAESHK